MWKRRSMIRILIFFFIMFRLLFMSRPSLCVVMSFLLQGSKRFLEDHLDASDSPLLSETYYTLCLDTLGSGDSLRLHVSKRPKETSPGYHFYQVRNNTCAHLFRVMYMLFGSLKWIRPICSLKDCKPHTLFGSLKGNRTYTHTIWFNK